MKDNEKERLLFIYPKKISFINGDIKILSENYIVIQNTDAWAKKIFAPVFMLKQLFFLLFKINSFNYIISSFGGYWSFFPVILGKVFKRPVYIILHGTDCSAFEEIGYGNIRKPILRYVLKTSYKYATRLLPVSDSLVYTENSYYLKNRVIKQGYKYFFPKINTAYTVIHNAIDTEKWVILNDEERKKNTFITVLAEGQFVRKGGEIIVKIAGQLPQYEFIFVGINRPETLKDISSNITFIPFTPQEELLVLYNRCKYYLQLSIFEGFGVALCEAMACGCIPVVANSNMLPEIVGDTGYVLKHRDPELLQELLLDIEKEDNQSLGMLARKRVATLFSLDNRKKKLYSVLEGENIASK